MKQFGLRLQVVGILPTLLAVGTIAFLLVADAPHSHMDWQLVVATAQAVGASGAIAITALAVAVSVSLQPLQFRFVQLLEGYWPLGQDSWIFRAGVALERRRFDRLRDRLTITVDPDDQRRRLAAEARASDAEQRLRTRFPRAEVRLMPTSLANALRSFEDRAGARYGLESVVTIWPRLYPLLPKDFRSGLEDEVTQLDVSARLCITWAATAAVALSIELSDPSALLRNWPWLFVVILLITLSVLSYQSAVESALAHGLDVEVALDLYRAKVVEGMRLPATDRLSQERRVLAKLSLLFESYSSDDGIELRYKRATGRRGSPAGAQRAPTIRGGPGG